MVETYFGFPHKLAETSNRMRFLRTKYKRKLLWDGYSVCETCIPEDIFLCQVTGSGFLERDDIHVGLADALEAFGESTTSDPNNPFASPGGMRNYLNFNPFLSHSQF